MAHNVVRSRRTPRSATALLTGGSLLAVSTGAGAFAAALLATPAGASAFTVTTLNSAGAGSLRQAITDANAAAGIDTIDFAPGLTGEIWLTSSLPTISEGVTITGPGATALTINGVSLYHAFDIDTQGTGAVTISGLTVTHSVGSSANNRGGAIRANDTGLTLNDVHLTNNSVNSLTTNAYGGALDVDNNHDMGDVTILNSVISHNGVTSSAQYGSDVGGGFMITADNVTITNTVLDENEADSGGGGYVIGSDSLAVENVAVTANHANTFVGGIVLASSHLQLQNSTVTGNTSGGQIGGMYIGGEGYGVGSTALQVSNTRISNNSAVGDVGGGKVVSANGQAILDGLTVTDNVGTTSGGLAVLGSTTITTSTIADNTGDGIDFGYGFEPVAVSTCALSSMSSLRPATPLAPVAPIVRVSNSTVTGNSRNGIDVNRHSFAVGSAPASTSGLAPANCGHFYDLPVDLGLVLSLVADNAEVDVSASAISLFSLIENPSADVIAGFGTITGVDPGLLPLESVSDTVSVVPLSLGSAAWNAGWPHFIPPPETDQRGLPRVVDIIDIGAYEVQEPFVLPKFTG